MVLKKFYKKNELPDIRIQNSISQTDTWGSGGLLVPAFCFILAVLFYLLQKWSGFQIRMGFRYLLTT